jgi:hypothetical protein
MKQKGGEYKKQPQRQYIQSARTDKLAGKVAMLEAT